ncbi:MAG: hypothetical protein ACI80K_001250, partial [Paracoccaceae bacterium]
MDDRWWHEATAETDRRVGRGWGWDAGGF